MAPFIPKDVLDYLQGIFPNRLPEHVTTIEDVALRIGQQKVINHLLSQYHRQNVLAP